MSTGRRARSARPRLRWAAAGAALAATATAAVITAPASNAATVGAQLALTGVAYSKAPTGGNTVGVHPGDTVSFSASAIPTAGAGPLSGLLSGLAGTLLGFEVDIPAHQLPGVSNAVKLVNGNHCSGGVPSVSVHYPNKGTFSFTYTVRRFVAPATVLTPCQTSQIKFNGSQLSQLTHNHVAVNATTTYTVHVVVATNPPAGGGLPIQVPSVVVGGGGGPVNLPTVKVGVPQGGGGVQGQGPGSVNGGAPVAGGGAQNGRGGAAGDLPQYQGVPETVPEMVVPHGGGGGGSGDGTGGGTTNGGGGGAAALVPADGVTGNLAPTADGERVATAASDSDSPSAPTGLLLAAAAALVVVAAGYTRLVIARRRA